MTPHLAARTPSAPTMRHLPCARGASRHDELGAGVALAIGAVAAVLVLAVAVLTACGLAIAAARVDAATDAAALAAADAALGFVDGEPCARAAMVADANDAVVVACSMDGTVATITSIDAHGLPVASTAVAGPPSER